MYLHTALRLPMIKKSNQRCASTVLRSLQFQLAVDHVGLEERATTFISGRALDLIWSHSSVRCYTIIDGWVDPRTLMGASEHHLFE